jgi:hypothetical protein
LLEVPEGVERRKVLHAAAHHLTHPVFPPHGAEWAAAYLTLLERWCGVGISAAMREEFDSRDVHHTVEQRLKRVRLVNVPRGILAKVVLDDPPEAVICQLLSVEHSTITISNDAGVANLPTERARYISHAPVEQT